MSFAVCGGRCPRRSAAAEVFDDLLTGTALEQGADVGGRLVRCGAGCTAGGDILRWMKEESEGDCCAEGDVARQEE